MKKLHKLLTLCAIPFLLMACDETKQPASKAAVGTTQSSSSEQDKMKQAYQDAKKLNSFSAGSMMAANQAYVIFDPQCPHCAKLWAETKKVNGVNFNWIPVGFLNPKSTQQGAVILSSPESAKLMNLHEELLSNNMGGMVTNEVPQAGIDKVKENTEFFKKNFESVPVILFQNSKTKEFGIINGSVPKAILDDKLGLTP
jgi:thiol:disulfide interchange protein DsbG